NTMTGRAVAWTSSNTAMATVSSSGLVTGVTAGSATITATSEGKSGTAAITVTPAPVATVAVTPTTASLTVGQTTQLSATLKDANGNTLTGRTVAWTSSNTSMATVSSSGLVTGVTAGSATITATSEGKSGTAAITVTTSSGGAGGHVVIVLEENTNYSSSIGNMPWLDAQIVTGGSATSYYATTHPSIGNYFMLTTGQNITNNDSYATDVNVDNVIRQLNRAGKTWKG